MRPCSIIIVLLLSGCAAAKPVVINYERTELGVLVACVHGEPSCREPSEKYQRELVREILSINGCKAQ